MKELSLNKNRSKCRDILLISITYILAHGFLLIASGRWWDDWVYADKNWDYLLDVMLQSSAPLTAFLDASNWLFPDGFYRILVFIWYYISTILFYMILGEIDIFESKSCVWIAILYSVVPVNDCRITWILYPYSVGLVLFFLGCYIAISNKKVKSKLNRAKRMASIVSLMLGYCFIQSSMMLTAPLLLYLYYEELKPEWDWKNVRLNIKKIFVTVCRNMDYLLAPIIWYLGDKILFPGYGIYSGHNYITWSKLPGIILRSPVNALATFKSILLNYYGILCDNRALLFVMIVVVCYVIVCVCVEKKCCITSQINIDQRQSIIMIVVGAGIFFASFFPYAVKRDSAIGTVYAGGRDAVLLGIGTSILIYYGIHLLFKEKICNIILVVFITVGVLHFNLIYMDWQEDYYQQLQLQDEFSQNIDIINNDTFLVLFKNARVCTSFYQVNGNSWAAIGDEKRFFISGVGGLSYLVEDTEDTRWFLNAYMMNEYDYGDRVVDGIIFVDYADISRGTMIKQKWNELFDKNAFNGWIHDIKSIKYVAISKKESDALLQMYRDDVLTDSVVYNMYYK